MRLGDVEKDQCPCWLLGPGPVPVVFGHWRPPPRSSAHEGAQLYIAHVRRCIDDAQMYSSRIAHVSSRSVVCADRTALCFMLGMLPCDLRLRSPCSRR